jgi:hypothetical protein
MNDMASSLSQDQLIAVCQESLERLINQIDLRRNRCDDKISGWMNIGG